MEKFEEIKKFHDIDLINLFSGIEKEERFQKPSLKSSGIMYHLYSRMIRSVKVANLVFESNIENNYTEAIPVLRHLVETYFHICYVNGGKNDDEIIFNEYEELSKLQKWKLGRDFNELKKEKPQIHSDNIEFMNEFYVDKPKPNPPKHLEKIYLLAKTVGEYDVYVELYSLLSSFIHFNPMTKANFGEQVGDTFSFNKFVYDKKMDTQIRRFICRVVLLSMVQIASYFNLDDFEDNQLKDSVVKWRIIDGTLIPQ
ncbi:DUF5677 domain-containing protein [Paenibacillus macerans]|uniref:DUF5677 domain-containing protein n=1 Tax=Paenibacillus macerans TaxID=44252 RepID=UPI002DB8C789|nr:DUF5677 domain-containing protein [Paenibacillus macerans]MEC0136135.1 DUF5677 domain-containing protein [Paenibacillus macerans]